MLIRIPQCINKRRETEEILTYEYLNNLHMPVEDLVHLNVSVHKISKLFYGCMTPLRILI